MGSVDKSSVRAEFDKIKKQFKNLSDSGKISSEAVLLFTSLFTLFEIVLAIFMEKSTRKTKKNSGIPSSQTEEDETADDSSNQDRKNNKRKPNKGDLSNKQEKVYHRTIAVNSCQCCGEDLSDQDAEDYERRTLIDIVYETRTTHTDAEIKTCQGCKTVNKGRFPSDLQGIKQYGNGVKAFLINLFVVQMVALNRVQQLLFNMIGHMVSEAVMLKYAFQLYIMLERWEHEETEKMIKQNVINTDETSMKVDKRRHWIHVCSSGDTVLKFLHPKRGSEAIEDINIIPRFSGVIVHDCWASYLSYENCRHGLCGSHILRELEFIKESNGYRWAYNMKRLLKDTAKTVSRRKRKKLTKREIKRLRSHYRTLLTRGEAEMPEIPKKRTSKRGKIAKSDAHNLLERLRKYEDSILLFAEVAEVPFTNNRAERDIRMSKVKQKVSGCFRTEKYAKVYCRITSYIQTMTNKGYTSLAAIEMALTGEIYSKEV